MNIQKVTLYASMLSIIISVVTLIIILVKW